jgi:hypothetical protein
MLMELPTLEKFRTLKLEDRLKKFNRLTAEPQRANERTEIALAIFT